MCDIIQFFSKNIFNRINHPRIQYQKITSLDRETITSDGRSTPLIPSEPVEKLRTKRRPRKKDIPNIASNLISATITWLTLCSVMTSATFNHVPQMAQSTNCHDIVRYGSFAEEVEIDRPCIVFIITANSLCRQTALDDFNAEFGKGIIETLHSFPAFNKGFRRRSIGDIFTEVYVSNLIRSLLQLLVSLFILRLTKLVNQSLADS